MVLAFGFSLKAQDYSVNSIPNELKEGAYAVIRKNDQTVDFLKYNQAKYSSEFVVTVLNESGLKYAYETITYRKSTKINKFEASLYDANGKLIRKLRNRDLKDVSADDGFSLFIDTRIQYYEFTPTTYPFTIKYNIEYTFTTTINLPHWSPVSRYNVGVENSSLTLNNHTNISIRKKEYGIDLLDVTKNESGKSISYSTTNVPPITEEVLSPPLSELTPQVFFSPNEFQLEGVRGKMEDWKEFGKWYYHNLIKDKIDLSEAEKRTAIELVDGVSDPVEKVRILYEYMQTKTRYVNIAIGIGGWEPFPASYVSDKSYGDCKALSNYMVSLLNAVGIDAFYTVVYGEHSHKLNMKEDFTSLQGNHIIVNVPMEDETLWLECTSQQTAFNYLGQFTDDRMALSISPEGGKIVTTQKYPAEVNKEHVIAKGEILGNGNLKTKYKIKSSGLQYDRYYRFGFMSEKEQNQVLQNYFKRLPSLKIENFDFENDRTDAVFTLTAQVESPQYAKVVGDNIIFNILSFEGATSDYRKDSNRKHPFEIRYGYTDITDFELTIPKGFKLHEEFQPKIHIDEFGSYLLTVEQKDERTLKINRKLVVNDGKYPKEKFNDYVEFQRKVSSMDNTKLLIERI